MMIIIITRILKKYEAIIISSSRVVVLFGHDARYAARPLVILYRHMWVRVDPDVIVYNYIITLYARGR